MSKSYGELSNVIGDRGEFIVRALLTEYVQFDGPLFRPVYMGEKHQMLDFFVELTGGGGGHGYFMAQVKTTTRVPNSKGLPVPSISKDHWNRISKLPGPSFMFGVQEQTSRVFAVAMRQPRTRGVASVPLKNELSVDRLLILYEEVKEFWAAHSRKPAASTCDL